MEDSLTAILNSLKEAYRMLEVAKSRLEENNVPDIRVLNQRVEALQDATIELLQQHNALISRKNEVSQMLDELGSLNALAVAGAVSSLPSLNDLP